MSNQSNRICKKVKFSDENSALFTLKKITQNSTIIKKPNRAYLCSKCGCWHLTSRPDFLAIQNENTILKKENQELKKRLEVYDKIKKSNNTKDDREIRYRVKKDEQIKQLKQVNSLLSKKLSDRYKTNKELVHRLSSSINTLEQCLNNGNNNDIDLKELLIKAINKIKNQK